ncbi:Arrestin domain-containing protein [Rutstroemia sp. NJR-2017a BBW]|nr:Arrestin domain-containing protein [Rutstroemia sp. NJR-2017a BBW]
MSGPGPGYEFESLDGRMGRPSSFANSTSDLSIENTSSPSLAGVDSEKPVASSNGVYVYIKLAEPIIYLSGLDHDGTTRDSSSNSSAILRGKLQLNITKSAKIKAVTLKFTGRARTEWPEGIPPAKTETFEEDSLRTQVLPFFNASYIGSEVGYGTLCNYVLRDKVGNTSVTPLSSGLDSPGFSLPIIGGRNRSSTLMSSRETKRLSLQSNQSRSFGKGDSPFVSTPQQKGYKIFHPGVYEYSFEIPIDNNSPETTKLPLASVIWQLEAFVERAGTFRPNLQGFKEVPVIRTPSIESLELVEPISISRNWEDQLHYEIMISGKSFPLGSRIPIAFKLTPLAKVHVHKIKVLVTENLEYTTGNRKVTRKDVQKKLLLLEKSAGRPLAKEYSHQEVRVLRGGESSPEDRAQARASAMREREREARRLGIQPLPLPEPAENMLGDLDLGVDHFIGSTELEMSVQLPTCEMMEKDKTKRLVHDCTWKNVSTHHWIKIVMRISRKDPEDPTGKKRRHFEISIDSPFTILSCHASQPQLALPAYADIGKENSQARNRVCGCPNAAMESQSTLASLNAGSFDNLSLASPARPETAAQPLRPPPQAHLAMHNAVQRPIHMLRNPSYNPPAFDAEDPPPPMPTPPPMYDQVVGTPSHDGLADYFSRLSEEYDDEDHTDDEDVERAVRRGRVNVAHPHTPGGRINRSMDISRDFMFTTAGLRYDRQTENEPRATTTMAT